MLCGLEILVNGQRLAHNTKRIVLPLYSHTFAIFYLHYSQLFYCLYVGIQCHCDRRGATVQAVIYKSTIFLHVLLIFGIAYQIMLLVLTLLTCSIGGLEHAYRHVLAEPRCEIRFHGRPNRNRR